MSFEDERVENSVDTQIFAFDYYLRENLAEVLSCALTYTVIYRPEDPIEFISGKENLFFVIESQGQEFSSHTITTEENNLFLGDIHLDLIGNGFLPIA